MKHLILISLLLGTANSYAQEPTVIPNTCPSPDLIKLDKAKEAFSEKGYAIEDKGQKWKLSNVTEIQAVLDKDIQTGLDAAKKWESEGSILKRYAKKAALAPLWAIAPDPDESPTEALSPHLSMIVKVGLIDPEIELTAANANTCIYKAKARVKFKMAGVDYTFEGIPNLIFDKR